MCEGGEARTFICDVCGERLPDDVVIEHYCVEGGEARNHEAEVEAVARALNEAPPGHPFDDEALREVARRVITALDAVRRSPQGETCPVCGRPGSCCAEVDRLRSPQGEDVEAGIEAAAQAMCSLTGFGPHYGGEHRAMAEKAIAAYLSRCPSPGFSDASKKEE